MNNEMKATIEQRKKEREQLIYDIDNDVEHDLINHFTGEVIRYAKTKPLTDNEAKKSFWRLFRGK